jgi:hypothetical protein
MAVDGLRWVAENERTVRWLLGKWPDHMRDELRSVIVDRAPGIAATYDESKGASVGWHFVKNLRWYMWKWVNARNKRWEKHAGSLDDADECALSKLDARDAEHGEECAYHLARLSSYQRYVVVLHALDGMSFENIGELVGKGKAAVRQDYLDALVLANTPRRTLEEWVDSLVAALAE